MTFALCYKQCVCCTSCTRQNTICIAPIPRQGEQKPRTESTHTATASLQHDAVTLAGYSHLLLREVGSVHDCKMRVILLPARKKIPEHKGRRCQETEGAAPYEIGSEHGKVM